MQNNKNPKNNKQKNKKETMESQNLNPKNSSNVFSDILGSYTGVAADGEKPIQDADDL